MTGDEIDLLEQAFNIDIKIESLMNEIEMLRVQKEDMVSIIVFEGRTSDNFDLKKTVIRPRNKVSVDLLNEKYPSEYQTIKKNKENTLYEITQKKLKNIMESVTQAEAKAVLSKDELKSVLYQPGEITTVYDVVRKEVK